MPCKVRNPLIHLGMDIIRLSVSILVVLTDLLLFTTLIDE